MTKKEIADKLMAQYMMAESRYYLYKEKYQEERDTNRFLDRHDINWYRGKLAELKAYWDSIDDSRKALGITDKQWYDAQIRFTLKGKE